MSERSSEGCSSDLVECVAEKAVLLAVWYNVHDERRTVSDDTERIEHYSTKHTRDFYLPCDTFQGSNQSNQIFKAAKKGESDAWIDA